MKNGRGSWIRTNDLKYPKLPRYQAALYPARAKALARAATADKGKWLARLKARQAEYRPRLSPNAEASYKLRL